MSNKERFIWKEGDIEIIKSPGNKKEAGKEDVGDRVCWNCKYLISPVWSLPPVFRKAYPDGDGISIDILSGQFWHDHLFGDEKDKVCFEPVDGEKVAANEQNMDDTSWIDDLPDAPELPEGPDDVVAIFMVKPKEEGKR